MIELKSIVEAVLFAAQKPLTPGELRGYFVTAAEQAEEEAVRAFRKVKLDDIERALGELAAEHEKAARSYRLVCVAGAWQFVSQPDYAPWLRALAGERARPTRLSQPALETLAIIAYRQPITRAEVEQIRGVNIDGVLQTLVDRGLVEPVGRAEVIGRPMQYGTTTAFLQYFGLSRLESLPAADELRRIPVERPPSLVTVEAGLATAPPEQLTLQPQNPPATESAPAEPSPSANAEAAASEPSPTPAADPGSTPAAP